MPDPSGWRGNTLTTSFAAPRQAQQGNPRNGQGSNQGNGYSYTPPVVYVPVQAPPQPRNNGPQNGMGSNQGNGYGYTPPAQQNNGWNNSPGIRAGDYAAGPFQTPQGRSESQGLSQAWQNIGNPYNPQPMADQTRNPNTFSFGGQRANNGGQAQVAAIAKIMDRLSPYSGVTPPPQYTPIRDRTSNKVYNDRVPQDQVAEAYEPYQGDAQGQGETEMGVKYTPYQVPDLWTKPQPQKTAQMQNYPMIPIPAMPGGIGAQAYGTADYGGKDMVAALGSDFGDFTGDGLMGGEQSITIGPETMPDPPDLYGGGGLLGDGVPVPAIADRPNVYQPSESPMFQRGMAAVDRGMNAIKAPMQKVDDWLGDKFPGLYNADKGNPNPNNNDRSYPWNEPRLSGKDQEAYNDLTPTQRSSVAKFMAQGMSYENAVKAAGIKKKKSSSTTSNSGTQPKTNPYTAVNWSYPRYTQTWAGLPKGRGNV